MSQWREDVAIKYGCESRTRMRLANPLHSPMAQSGDGLGHDWHLAHSYSRSLGPPARIGCAIRTVAKKRARDELEPCWPHVSKGLSVKQVNKKRLI